MAARRCGSFGVVLSSAKPDSKAVAMDMSGAYAASVRTHAPHAIVTFDRFHVIKPMKNQRLDDLRPLPAWEAQDHDAKEAIKGLRWLLLHRGSIPGERCDAATETSLALNEPLQCAYLLKEELAELWKQLRRTRRLGILARMVREGKSQRHPPAPRHGAHLLRHAKGVRATTEPG